MICMPKRLVVSMILKLDLAMRFVHSHKTN